MNILVKNDKYVFNPGSKTITFVGLSSILLQSVYAIFNVNTNIQIYDFGDPTKGGTVNNNILTLDFDTSTMSANDPLLIKYDDGKILGSDVPMLVQDDSVALLRRIVRLLEASANVDVANRQRVSIDAAPASLTVGTLPTLPTLTTVTNPVPLGNLATIASMDQRQFFDAMRTNYNTGLRQALIFT